MKRFLIALLLIPSLAYADHNGPYPTPIGGGSTITNGSPFITPTNVMYATPANWYAQGQSISNITSATSPGVLILTAGNYSVSNTFWLSTNVAYYFQKGSVFTGVGPLIGTGMFATYTNGDAFVFGQASFIVTNNDTIFEMNGNGYGSTFYLQFWNFSISGQGHVTDSGQTNNFYVSFNNGIIGAAAVAPFSGHNHINYYVTGNNFTNNAQSLFNGQIVNMTLECNYFESIGNGMQAQSGGTFTTGLGVYNFNLANDSGLPYTSSGSELSDLTFVADNAGQNTLSGFGTYTNGVGFNFNSGQVNSVLAIGGTGVTNNTSDTYLVSVTAGIGMTLKDQTGAAVLSPIANDTFPLKPGWRLAGTSGITGVAVILNR